jgi:cyclic beta-1,2-glucan synthetase
VHELRESITRAWSQASRQFAHWKFDAESAFVEPPLRAELFSVEQLERHAKAIASSHSVIPGRGPDELLTRLAENKRLITETYDLVVSATAKDLIIEPAAEWLLDNFYVVEEQIHAIERLLPPAFCRELPRLKNGSTHRRPRVYSIALELIAHVDGRIDANSLHGFIGAYQSIQPLKIGELWALPLMLRIALIENLRRVSVRIAKARRERELANHWYQTMVEVVERKPTDLVVVLADMAVSNVELSGAFLSELTRHLQSQNPSFSLASNWLESRLIDQGSTTEQLVREEGQLQAADQLSVGNSFTSLRFLSSYDWREFVGEQSVVEKMLAADPAGIYTHMDFATRNRYRHAVEGIARRGPSSELEISQLVVRLAEGNAVSHGPERQSHVGYYLIDRGRPELERAARMRPSLGVLIDRVRQHSPLPIYLAVVGGITCLAMWAFLCIANLHLHEAWWLLLPAFFVASQLGVAIANWLSTQCLVPQSLARMDLRAGVPADCRTMVVIPTMLTSDAAIDSLLSGLELRFLNNDEPNLHFALLTDWLDSPTSRTPGDLVRLERVQEGIHRLNAKYSKVRNDIFFLFHRERTWNAGENCWMGHERKRGKLADLNATLLGARDRFSVMIGEESVLSSVRFVITLDTDTQLPRDAARQMIGTLAHPLNRAVVCPESRRVTAGYTILQPRVDVSLPGSQRSLFSKWNSLDVGIDPYTRVVSDVYQDLFGEGSFIGKGIYDVATFERCCHDFPENTILSHDLIEGAYGRSAFVSDITLYEEYPSHYATDIARRHRWIRGDWQIAGWLRRSVRNQRNLSVRNPTSWLSAWKLLDNLRRSLFPVAAILLWSLAWWTSYGASCAALVVILLAIYTAPLLAFASKLLTKPSDLPMRLHIQACMSSLWNPSLHGLLTLAFIPYEAAVSLDAIARTSVRMLITRRHLLQWQTASDSQLRTPRSLIANYYRMCFAPCAAIVIAAISIGLQRTPAWMVLPWVGLWCISPAIAWWISLPLQAPIVRWTTDETAFLRRLARRTWRYFEEFVTEEENWLPPDNIHLQTSPLVAPRTSPTNIGMSLLSSLAAYDFGYCSTNTFADRTAKTLATLEKMERFNGHWLNWYHTRTLAPLLPQYVSTVDSGNLAGCLLVLSSGCRELVNAPLLTVRWTQGTSDTLALALEESESLVGDPRWVTLRRELQDWIETLGSQPAGLAQSDALLERLMHWSFGLSAEAEGQTAWWIQALRRACDDHRTELRYLAPWLECETTSPFPSAMIPACVEAVRRLRSELDSLNRGATLAGTANLPATHLPWIEAALATAAEEGWPSEVRLWMHSVAKALLNASERSRERSHRLEQLARQAESMSEMDFTLLYSGPRELFYTGYNVSDRRMDSSCYDLLASEARLASFIAVAQGQVDQEHWFALGRLLTSSGRLPTLLSWSGSMFEYLMPLLIMPNYPNTLLDSTYRAAVRRQIEYGRQRGIPWGISESGYNAIDQFRTYQYRAFGVPGLGLKRGLADDLVIAPYASALALMVAPRAACDNLQRLAADGQLGTYGMFEAVDYTPNRLPPGTDRVTVRQYMAHHQGMNLLSLAHLLIDQPMQRRFQSNPMLHAGELLLQERIPKATAPVFPHASEAAAIRLTIGEASGAMRVITDPNTPTVESHWLSNGRYHVAISSAGGGTSRWGDLSLTRWREDATRDSLGSFCYLRDLDSNLLWSNTYQPTLTVPTHYEAIFTQSRAEFRRTDAEIETYTQISVSPEDDLELRRVTVTNRSSTPRSIELTSYAEVVLAKLAQDESHPAFSNLFVQTEWKADRNAILCTRRPRSASEHPPWMTHMMQVRGTTLRETSFETDRMQFIGRRRTLARPKAFDTLANLSNSVGSVLDPMVGIRQAVTLQPYESVQVDIVTGIADSRASIEMLTERYHDPNLADRVFDLAWTHSHILLQQLGISASEAQTYGALASSILVASSLRRASPNVLISNQQGQSGLWGYGISGDLPIAIVRIREPEHLELLQQAIQAHAYWRLKGLMVDLVIWNEDDSVYRQNLQERITHMVASSIETVGLDRPGGIFIRRGEQMSNEDRTLLQSVARIVLYGENGTFAEQSERRGRVESTSPLLTPIRKKIDSAPVPPGSSNSLALFNGLGGFSQDGREYIIHLAPGQTTPAPWVNVIANPQFGTVVSEAGSAYTWSENSHEYRLTPWHNDPVSDVGGEALYLRDDETGHYWSPSPSPVPRSNQHTIRHGFGYTIFESTEDGITTEWMVYVATDAPVKFSKIKITNRSDRPRRISVVGYWEWVLGDVRSKTLQHVVTEWDPASGALLARNVYNPDFGDRVAFVNCSEPIRSWTGDRTEFLGRNGSLSAPAAMKRSRLSGRSGAGYDPCAAMQMPLELGIGQEKTVSFTLGAGRNKDDAKALALRFRTLESADRAIHQVWAFWSHMLGSLRIETPDPSVNFLANGWLIYQTVACRMWARSGFYQSGGAFGFRDQLQDAMALTFVQPHLLREHLLLAAAHQFREGDVQHWWHPPKGRGVRTHFSDDYLWLPIAICRYVQKTGDTGILDEVIPFLTDRPLRDDEESNYDLPTVSDDSASLYEHGVRAMKRGLRFGEHGLPLIGCGDWNDGMNLVGQHGKGESVWLGFFLYDAMKRFSELARLRGDSAFELELTHQSDRLQIQLEQHGWDGEWYRRAYFDDGTPLGSIQNDECQIDAISQSWAVLSRAANRERAELAMDNLERRLVDRDARLIKLLDPPFDRSSLDPGYIKGYVPGVRENGGQYTHSAIWAVMAAAQLGDCDRAWDLFSLINPLSHADRQESIAKYRVEPYVVAADVYGVPPHVGRGGWTWYTGSASWMYRLILESLIGIDMRADRLSFHPCLPHHWPHVEVTLRYRSTQYRIRIEREATGPQPNSVVAPHSTQQLFVDGTAIAEDFVTLIDDHMNHEILLIYREAERSDEV